MGLSRRIVQPGATVDIERNYAAIDVILMTSRVLTDAEHRDRGEGREGRES